MTGRYTYAMDHDISGEDLEPLSSGLEDERGFVLGELVGQNELAKMLGAAHLDFHVTVAERFRPFDQCIEILSVYLPEYVFGVEVVEELDVGLKRSSVRCWRYIGRRGEVVKVALEYAVSLNREILPGREDVASLRAMWTTLPQWAQNAYKLTFDELADLDVGG